MGVENMNIVELRNIDKIYKEVTNNEITSPITVKDKITLIRLISGKKIKVRKPRTMQILITDTKSNKENGNLPNWMRKGGEKK